MVALYLNYKLRSDPSVQPPDLYCDSGNYTASSVWTRNHSLCISYEKLNVGLIGIHIDWLPIHSEDAVWFGELECRSCVWTGLEWSLLFKIKAASLKVIGATIYIINITNGAEKKSQRPLTLSYTFNSHLRHQISEKFLNFSLLLTNIDYAYINIISLCQY